MIGNDLIDLHQSRIESNWQRKGFIEKLFIDREQQLIKNYHDPEIMIWILWSMKEAAYKIYNRQTKIREYIPKKLSCSINKLDSFNLQGVVICNENIYYTKTVITSENIYSTAAISLEVLNNIIEVEKKGIVKDENGIPYLISTSENKIKDVSISHHGRFERVITTSGN